MTAAERPAAKPGDVTGTVKLTGDEDGGAPCKSTERPVVPRVSESHRGGAG
jgi:hypothetical protein